MNRNFGEAAMTSETSLPWKRPWPFDSPNDLDHDSGMGQPADSDYSNTVGYVRSEHYQCLLGSIIDVQVQECNTGGLNMYWNELIDYQFSVVQEGDYFALEIYGLKFGRLSKGACKPLHTLKAQKRVTLTGYASGSAWTAAVRSWLSKVPALLNVELNVYAFQCDAKEAGNILSKSGIFLQWPQYGREGYEYFNPHLLRLPGYSDQIPTQMPDHPTQCLARIPERSPEREVESNDSEIVTSILDSLSHHVQVHEVAAIPGMKSQLLEHQKEAVDFIFRRETAQAPPEQSLWKHKSDTRELPFYQHVITGKEWPVQAEVRGGIIADEMGLGKTLVMLWTIASSVDRAHEFAAAKGHQGQNLPSRKEPSRATLVIVPSAVLIDSWIDEVYKHTYPGNLTFHKYLGTSRHNERELLLLRQRHIVFTTYATVTYDFRHKNTNLLDILWFRIILDEAHDIRTRSTQQFQAVTSISAENRWCLTGTPIQNDPDDLGALVSFLKMPFLEKPQTFRKFITNPISLRSGNRFQNLQTLLQSMCLRRTRDLLDLPEPRKECPELHLSHAEHADYQALLQRCRKDIDMVVSGRRKNNLKSAMLQSLLKIRLFCNNGSAEAVMHLGLNGLPEDPDEAWSYLQQHEENICAYCHGIIYSISNVAETDSGRFLQSCRHLICHKCLHLKRVRKKTCPACASGSEAVSLTPLSSTDLNQSLRGSNPAQGRQYPTKLLRLLSDISRDPNHKSIVFSCWKKTLGIVGRLLRENKLRHYTIDGSLPNSERVRILNDFRLPTGANILLMTLGTGAVGLNLAAASRVYLLEPQWNPSIESQAIGRALRLGQTDHVVIVRYIVRGTVEESNVLNKQRKKLALAGGGFGRGKEMEPDTFQALLDLFEVNEGAHTSAG